MQHRQLQVLYAGDARQRDVTAGMTRQDDCPPNIVGLPTRREGSAPAPSILVVEDDVDLARVMITALQSHGIRTFHAVRGSEAIRLCRQHEPSLIVLDLTLPDMDGFAVVNALRGSATLGRISVLVYSALDVGHADRARLRLGPTEFLTKSRCSLAAFEGHVLRLLDTVNNGANDRDASQTPLPGIDSIVDEKVVAALSLPPAVWHRVGENLHDAILIFDPADETVLNANEKAFEVYGWSREDLIGRSLQSISVDPGRGESEIAMMLAAPQQTSRFRTRQRHSSGREIVLDVVASVIHYDGRIAILTVNRNVTEEVALLQQIEREVWSWTLTFDAIDAAVLVLDSGTAVLRLNEAARVLAEAPTFSDVLGRPVSDVGLGEPWRTFGELSAQAGMAGTLQRKQATDPFSQRVWDVAADSAEGPEGESRTVVIARDITNLVRLESSARRDEAVAEMGRLVANVAHEVRNPLFGISANVDTLELRISTEDPVVARCLLNLRREVRRMTALMQDLLDYGKLPALDVRLERSTTPVVDAVRGAMRSAAARGVTIENRVVDRGPVLIDRSRIEQALHNVIQNAAQHSEAGGRVVIESAVFEIGSDRWLRWSVDDRGPGFSSEAIQSAFEPFYTTRSDGTGLGLSIVRRVVDMHGGRASVENRREGGARVTIALPLQSEPS